MCAQGPSGIAHEELLELASAEGKFESRNFQKMVQAIVRLQSGDAERAVDDWPAEVGSRTALSSAYRAIANAAVGNRYSARKYLGEARDYVEQVLNSPDGTEIHWTVHEHRPIYWLMMQIAMREAEAAFEDAGGLQD
jgi:hypothetical protein